MEYGEGNRSVYSIQEMKARRGRVPNFNGMCLMAGGPLMCPSLKVPAVSKLGTKH